MIIKKGNGEWFTKNYEPKYINCSTDEEFLEKLGMTTDGSKNEMPDVNFY